jgi:hypothetical protein
MTGNLSIEVRRLGRAGVAGECNREGSDPDAISFRLTFEYYGNLRMEY